MECLFSVVSKTVCEREREWGVCVCVCVCVFIQGVSTVLDNFRRVFPRPKQGKKFAWIYVRKQFSRCSLATCWPFQFMLPSSILWIFYLWGHPKTLVYSGPVVNEETWPVHFLCPSNHSQLSWDVWKSATVHDQMCPSGGRHFEH